MAFNFKDLIKDFLAKPRQNLATAYEVEIAPPDKAPTGDYWRVAGVYHLSGDENRGGHYAYCEVVDQAGARVYGTTLKVTNVNSGKVTRDIIGKGPDEPGASPPIWSRDNLTIEVDAHGLPSEKVVGLRSTWASDGDGNTWGHHSFFAVFERATAGGSQPDEPGEPSPGPVTEYVIKPSPARITIRTDKGVFVAEAANVAAARRIVAGLKLLDKGEEG